MLAYDRIRRMKPAEVAEAQAQGRFPAKVQIPKTPQTKAEAQAILARVLGKKRK